MGWSRSAVREERGMYKGRETERETDHWGDPGVDGKIILSWIFRKWDVVVWIGLDWLRIETGDGQL
jgi:hypothetical protein